MEAQLQMATPPSRNLQNSRKSCLSRVRIDAYIFLSQPMFKTRHPKFLDAGSYLDPGLQTMFSLGYCKTLKEFIPTGWTELGEDKEYPTLASRSPQAHQPPTEDSGTDFEMTNGRTESESSNDDEQLGQNAFGTTTRMNEESSEDELSRPVSRAKVSVTSIFYILLCSSKSLIFHRSSCMMDPF
jgi:hypothetical protein